MKKFFFVLCVAFGLAGCGDRLSSDQRRAVDAAMYLSPGADLRELERRAESWTEKEMANLHRMAAVKRDNPAMWHEAKAAADSAVNSLP